METSDNFENIYTSYENCSVNYSFTTNDTAEILYTLGTTGKPKGVALSHSALVAVASMFVYEMEINADSRMLILMPLTHSALLNLSLLGAVYAGAATVLGDFTPQNLGGLAAQEKTTHFFGAPSMKRAIYGSWTGRKI